MSRIIDLVKKNKAMLPSGKCSTECEKIQNTQIWHPIFKITYLLWNSCGSLSHFIYYFFLVWIYNSKINNVRNNSVLSWDPFNNIVGYILQKT